MPKTYKRNGTLKILVSGLINIETNIAIGNFPIHYCSIEYSFNKVSFDISGVAYNVMNALSVLGDEIIPVSIIGKDPFGNFIKEKKIWKKYAFPQKILFKSLMLRVHPSLCLTIRESGKYIVI